MGFEFSLDRLNANTFDLHRASVQQAGGCTTNASFSWSGRRVRLDSMEQSDDGVFVDTKVHRDLTDRGAIIAVQSDADDVVVELLRAGL